MFNQIIASANVTQPGFPGQRKVLLATPQPVDVNSFVNKTLPPLPGSAMQVVSLLQDINSSTRDIADAIGHDPMLTAKILRAANSPLYVSERNVASLPKAVITLGNQAVYLLVISFTAFDSFAQEIRTSPIGCAVWKHSLAVGLAAREIGLLLKLRSTEELFTCGLLHDIGRLLFLRHDPLGYSQVKETASETRVVEFEKETYGFTHAEVGALAMNRWGLPAEVAEIIRHHHHPHEAEQFVTMTHVVSAADEVVDVFERSRNNKEEMSNLAAHESIIALQISFEQIQEVWEKTQTGLQEIAQILS